MKYQAKKSFGQHFLKSKTALDKMIETSHLNKDDIVLEIGPGKGVLTKRLLEKSKKVIAIEKDLELFNFLKEKFSFEIKNKKLFLIAGDILDFEIFKLKIKKYKIISNIPYNITGAILKKFLSAKNQPNLMTLLVQKEVAQRIVAKKNQNLNKIKESLLSLSVKAYGQPFYLMKVEKRFFSPAPKVDSAIIKIENISKKNFKSKREENLFFQIIKAGFSHKRKVVIKNLENNLSQLKNKNQKTKESWLEIFKKLKINPQIRAENLSFELWQKITRFFLKI
jgi:16S rRNA (adenine1518-N6/adenine1519-N6)-dimethyltransferase